MNWMRRWRNSRHGGAKVQLWLRSGEKCKGEMQVRVGIGNISDFRSRASAVGSQVQAFRFGYRFRT